MTSLNTIPDRDPTFQTVLYDCSVDLRIEIQRDEYIDNDLLCEATMMTIAQEMAGKIVGSKIVDIYRIMNKTIPSFIRHRFWVVEENRDRVALEISLEKCGHGLSSMMMESVIYDTVKYSGEVDSDLDAMGSVTIYCNVTLFLSPAVYGAQQFYEDHGFPNETDNPACPVEYIIRKFGIDAGPNDSGAMDFVMRWQSIWRSLKLWKKDPILVMRGLLPFMENDNEDQDL